MPLYTYVANYRDQTYIGQSRRSNPKGFVDWVDYLPKDLRERLDTYRGDFERIPNRTNVWRISHNVEGDILVVVVIQTEG